MLLKLYYFHRSIASSAAVDKHVAQHTHGDSAGPLEVVATPITQGGGLQEGQVRVQLLCTELQQH